MKKKELQNLKEKNKIELSKLISEKKVELLNLTGKMYAGREKNVKKGKNLRKDISQLFTIMTKIGETK